MVPVVNWFAALPREDVCNLGSKSHKESMMERLSMTADRIGASRRVLVCRIGRRIATENLLVARLPVWLKTSVA